LADVTDAILGRLNILLDSDVTIGRRVSENTFLLLEVYRRGALEGLVKKKIGDWCKGHGVRLTASPVISVRRINLHKTLLKAVMVVSDHTITAACSVTKRNQSKNNTKENKETEV
jgi:hypothetical protein